MVVNLAGLHGSEGVLSRAFQQEAVRFAATTPGVGYVDFDFHKECGATRYDRCGAAAAGCAGASCDDAAAWPERLRRAGWKSCGRASAATWSALAGSRPAARAAAACSAAPCASTASTAWTAPTWCRAGWRASSWSACWRSWGCSRPARPCQRPSPRRADLPSAWWPSCFHASAGTGLPGTWMPCGSFCVVLGLHGAVYCQPRQWAGLGNACLQVFYCSVEASSRNPCMMEGHARAAMQELSIATLC